jgi:hypothetical protein
MTTRIKYLVWIFIFMSSCVAVKFSPKDFEGTYTEEGLKGFRLTFKKNHFAYVDTFEQTHLPPYDCCDTITYGYWEFDKPNLLKLFSDPKLDLPLELEVNESTSSTDSIYFVINDLIEEAYKNDKRPDILYGLWIDSDSRLLSHSFVRKHNTNRITFDNSEGGRIRKFSVTIYPKESFRGRNIGTREATTVEYTVANTTSNVFEIRIPELDKGYLTYLRLNGDYVKIISNDRLIWDNNEYTKSK